MAHFPQHELLSPVSKPSSSQHLPGLDVLRGLAALAVAWFHSRVDLWVGFKEIHGHQDAYSTAEHFTAYISLPVSQFGSMVMLFFVISGFCIHLPFARQNKKLSFRSYLTRRFFRIYPAYAVVVILCFFLQVNFKHQWSSGSEGGLYLSTLSLLQNWTYASQVYLNPSLWSIPVECEFYLVYPLLLFVHRRNGIRGSIWFTLACTAIGIGIYCWSPTVASLSFFKYAIIWNSGAWLAHHYANDTLPHWSFKLSLIFFVSVGLSCIINLVDKYPFFVHYLWGLSSFLCLWYVLTDGAKFFQRHKKSTKVLSHLGLVSYSIYLIHFPFFRVMGLLWIEYFGEKPVHFFIPTLFTLLTIPMAFLFYHWIEAPSNLLGKRLASSKVG